MNIKKSIITIMLMLFACSVYAEYVFLRDGAIIQGKIISDSATTIIITDKKNKRQTIARNNIIRILYTDIYLGKIYVQKTDGKNEICYMVDEDRDTYTFRRELYSPEEFTLRRDQVLFIARGNPTGLEGEPGTDTIDLKWMAPYNPVTKYRVYMKGPGDREFKASAETKKKNYSFEKLNSNTKYIFYVKAIDASGSESLPSNELTVTTLNIKPGRPVKLRYESRKIKMTGKEGKDKEKSCDFIMWDSVTDPDGTTSGYNIYLHVDGKDKKLATVTGTEYGIPDGISVYDLRIAAVDDRNDESPLSRIRHSRAVKAGIEPLCLVPMGCLADMFNAGSGAEVYLSEKNFLMPNLELGFSAGAVSLPGKDTDKIEDMLLVPVTADAGYHFVVSEFFTVMPCISLGYAFMDVNYISVYEKKNSKTWEPFVRAGAMLNYEFEDLQLSWGIKYGFIYETSEVKPFVELLLRAGIIIDL